MTVDNGDSWTVQAYETLEIAYRDLLSELGNTRIREEKLRGALEEIPDFNRSNALKFAKNKSGTILKELYG